MTANAVAASLMNLPMSVAESRCLLSDAAPQTSGGVLMLDEPRCRGLDRRVAVAAIIEHRRVLPRPWTERRRRPTTVRLRRAQRSVVNANAAKAVAASLMNLPMSVAGSRSLLSDDAVHMPLAAS